MKQSWAGPALSLRVFKRHWQRKGPWEPYDIARGHIMMRCMSELTIFGEPYKGLSLISCCNYY